MDTFNLNRTMMLASRKLAVSAALFAAVALGGCINDDDDPTGVIPQGAATISQDIRANRTFYAETTYTISGFVHVDSGFTLTIQPGTRIVGDFDVASSSLFILPGAQIIARGEAERPIVFTSERSPGSRQPGDWGGLIIVGRGEVNRNSPSILEGTGTGANNPQVNYAGRGNNADDSGELRYVRVEFAGHQTGPNQELNSFTFAAVGSGTELAYLQAMAGLDDSFEWFGGAADAKYLVSYESGDDHFDAAEGFQGRVQYAIAYQDTVLPARPGTGSPAGDPQGIENDGCDPANCKNGQLSEPKTQPLFANFTLVGTGTTTLSGGSGGVGMMLRRGAGGHYVNGVIARWPRAAISLRDTSTKVRADAGDLMLRNIYLVQNGAAFQTGGTAFQFSVDATANAIEQADGSVTAATVFTAVPDEPTSATQLDWSLTASAAPRAGGLTPFTGSLATRAGTVVTATSYRGAADPNGAKWWQGWTVYSRR